MILPNCKQITCRWHKAEGENSCQLLPVGTGFLYHSLQNASSGPALLVRARENA